MPERKTIVVPGSDPLEKRVSSAGAQIRDWLASLDVTTDASEYALRLKRWDRKSGNYRYHYELMQRREPQGPTTT